MSSVDTPECTTSEPAAKTSPVVVPAKETVFPATYKSSSRVVYASSSNVSPPRITIACVTSGIRRPTPIAKTLKKNDRWIIFIVVCKVIIFKL
ncbi:TPA: hypothetical protein DEP58_01125 [Patescibacteria group bacterium]|nr:hypothetical protein [Patescibacteria group bacterium]